MSHHRRQIKLIYRCQIQIDYHRFRCEEQQGTNVEHALFTTSHWDENCIRGGHGKLIFGYGEERSTVEYDSTKLWGIPKQLDMWVVLPLKAPPLDRSAVPPVQANNFTTTSELSVTGVTVLLRWLLTTWATAQALGR